MRFRDEPPVVKWLAVVTFTIVGIAVFYLLSMVWSNPPIRTVSDSPKIEANSITGAIQNDSPDNYLFETVQERVPLFKYGDRVITGELLRSKADGRCFIMTWPVTGNPTFIPHACPEKKPLVW